MHDAVLDRVWKHILFVFLKAGYFFFGGILPCGLRLLLRSFLFVFLLLFGDRDLDRFFLDTFLRGELSRLRLLSDGDGVRLRDEGEEGESYPLRDYKERMIESWLSVEKLSSIAGWFSLWNSQSK